MQWCGLSTKNQRFNNFLQTPSKFLSYRRFFKTNSSPENKICFHFILKPKYNYMKKFSFLGPVFAMLVLIACTSKKEGGMSDAANKNLDAHHGIVKMFEAGDWSKAGDFIAKDAIDHGAGPTGGDIVGLDSMMANFNKMGEMMDDMKMKTIKELADDDYVMAWMEQTATANVDAPEWGMKKGVTATYSAIEVSKYKDGKVTEHWSFMTMADMMKMMGGSGNMQMPDNKTEPVKDSTSK